MIMQKKDRRTRYTEKMIKETFIELLKKKPINKITVTEICRISEMNRGTFYLHFSNCNDVLEKIEDELAELMINAISGTHEGENFLQNLIIEIYEIISKKRSLFYIVFQHDFPSQSFTQVINYGKDKYIKSWMERSTITEEQAEWVYTYIMYGTYGIFRKMYQEEFQFEFNQVKEIISNLITNGLYNLVRKSL